MNRKRGYLLIAIAAVTYSTTEVAIKSLSGVFAPMQLTVERVLVAGLLLLPLTAVQLRRRDVHLTRGDAGYFAAIGFLTVALHMSFLQMALLNADASAVAAIYSGNPVFAALGAHWILQEPLRRRNIVALLFELLGIFIIVNPFAPQMNLAGFVQVLLATVLFALYGVLSKLRLAKFGSIPTSCLSLLFGGGELLAVLLLGSIPAVAALFRRVGLGLYAQVPLLSGFTVRSALVFLYICIVVTALGYVLLTRAIEYTSATEASFIYFAKPLVATALAAVLMGERVSAQRAAGLVCFAAASLTVLLPALKEMKAEKATEKT